MLFKASTIVTVNDDFQVIEDGAIVVRDDRIIALGGQKEMAAKFPQEQVIDWTGHIIMPGLISLHVHLAQSLLRSSADDLSLILWLCDKVWPMQGSFSEEDGHVAAQLTIAEMLKSGTTTFVESLFAERYGFEGAVRAVVDSGIRACLGKVVMDQPRYATQDGITMHPGLVEDERSLENALQCHEKFEGAGNGRVEVWFGARTPGGVSETLYKKMVREARSRNIGITMHCAEVKADRDFFASQNHTPMTYCRDLGLLGPRTVLAHMVHLDDYDIEILRGTGTSVAHCPTSNAKLGSGIARVNELLQSQINVGLGCDGCPCNNVMDLFQEMKTAALLPKAVHKNPQLVSAKQIVQMVTINGAKAIGKSHEIGSIEVGKKADFISLNLSNKIYAQPLGDPISMLVYIATGADVENVIIDGCCVLKDGLLQNINESELIRKANLHGEQIKRRADC